MRKINTDLPEFIYQSSMTALIDKIEEVKEDAELSWNTWGGGTGSGQIFIDYVNKRENKLDANVSGYVASMGVAILPFFNKVIGAEQADVMIHAVSGGASSTHKHTNEFIYNALAKKIDEAKFEEITGHKLKNIFLGSDEQKVDVWTTGLKAKKFGLFDETYNLLDSKVASLKGKLDVKELDYDLPENIKQKYGLIKETKTNNNDMEIKDVTVDKLAKENVDVYNTILDSGKKAEQNRVAGIMKYAEYDMKKANEIIASGEKISLEDVEYFMEKKHNKKAVADLEDASEEGLKAAKTTKNEPELSKEDKEEKVAFDQEVSDMREDSGVKEILEKK